MRQTLRRKILLGYGLVLLLAVLVFAWAFVNLLRLGRATDAILSENYRSILAAENMINAIERQDSGVLLYVLGYEDQGIRQFRENQIEFSQWLGRAKDNVTIRGERDVLDAIDSSYATYLTQFTRLLAQEAPSPERTAAVYHETLLPTFLAVRGGSTTLRDLNQETMVAASNRARRVAQTAMWSMGAVGVVTLALGLFFSLMLSNRLVQPLRRMRDATSRIARGDYDVEVPATTTDELGQLAAQFNEMAAKIQGYRAMNVEQIVAEKRKKEAVIESIDDALIVIDADFDIQDLNPAAARILNVEPGHAQGRHFLEIVKNDRLFGYVKETIASGRPPVFKEDQNFLTVRRGGEPRHFQFTVTPVYAPSHTLLGVILMLRDVTKLKELDRLKSEFVATASHELKTPLTSIGMSINLLQERTEDRLDARDRELLEAAHEDVERLTELVNDLLDLSKIEAGKIELERQAVPVALLFEKATQSLRAQAEEHELELSSSLPGDLPAVKADPNKMAWVLTNLISNALRYTNPGGHIRLTAERVGSTVHVSVADDGEGIPYAYQSKIFDKFVQVGSARSVGGSGLGLAICKEIVRAHGGRIWVESTPGEGSTFTFTLPVAPQD